MSILRDRMIEFFSENKDNLEYGDLKRSFASKIIDIGNHPIYNKTIFYDEIMNIFGRPDIIDYTLDGRPIVCGEWGPDILPPPSWYISASPKHPTVSFNPEALANISRIYNESKSFPVELILLQDNTVIRNKNYYDIETDLMIGSLSDIHIGETRTFVIDSLANLIPNDTVNKVENSTRKYGSCYIINWGNIRHKTNFEICLDETRDKIKNDKRSRKTHRGKGGQ